MPIMKNYKTILSLHTIDFFVNNKMTSNATATTCFHRLNIVAHAKE